MPAPRKADALHELHSTIPHDRASDVSNAPEGRPRFPKDLPKQMRPIFKRVVRQLEARRTATAGDAELIRLYCFVYERHQRNVELLLEEGEICETTKMDNHGVAHIVMRKNLRKDIVTEAEKQMASILNQLGLTQVSKDKAKPASKVSAEPELTEGEKYMRSINERASGVVKFTPMAPPTSFEDEEVSPD